MKLSSVTAIADKLGIEFALIHRQRMYKSENAPEKMEVLVGDVRDKVAILVDDMIDTGNTLVLAAKSLHENGAKKIFALISHGTCRNTRSNVSSMTLVSGLFSETKMSRIEQLPIEHLVVRTHRLVSFTCSHLHLQVTNTIPQGRHREECSKLVTIDVSPTIAESIRRTHNGESISLLFGDWAEEANMY